MRRSWLGSALLVAGCAVPTAAPEQVLPRLVAVSLEPAAPRAGDVLVARAEVEEAEGHTLALTWVFTVDGREVARGPGSTLAGVFRKGERVVATAVPRVDGVTGPGLGAEVTVVNSPPVVSEVQLSPDPPRAAMTPLVCSPSLVAQDADGDTLTWSFRWLRDGQPQTDGLARTSWPDDTVPAEALTEGERWRCEARVGDGEVEVDALGAEREVAFGIAPRWGVPEAGDAFSCVLSEGGVPTCWGADEPASAPLEERFARVFVGATNACGVRLDDLSLACWGSATWGLTDPPAGVFVEVAIGVEHACALTPEGEAVCWGRAGWPSTLPPAGFGPWRSLAAGAGHTCGLDLDGHPKCWGGGWGGNTVEPFSEVFEQLALGSDHGCGLRADGSVRCWGGVAQGQGSVPSASFRALGARSVGTCGLEAGGDVVCWGNGAGRYPLGAVGLSQHLGVHACGVLADGGLACVYADGATGRGGSFGQDVPPTERWEVLSAGTRLTCGLDADGWPGCFGGWGRNGLPDEPLVAIGAGTDAACGVRAADLRAVCWGRPDLAGLDLVPDEPLQTVAVGDGLACGLRADGEAVCWGDEAVVAPPGPFRELVVADDYACALDGLGQLTCWGPEDPRTVSTGVSYASIDADADHACGVTLDGDVDCWGRGQVPADRKGDYASVSVALGNACALTRGGRLDCWGESRFGLTQPPRVIGLVTTNGGFEQHCGLDDEGRVFCWGSARRLPLGWTPDP